MVRVLLSAGADKDARDENGDTALHCAVWQRHTGPVGALLAAGADPNAQDDVRRRHPHTCPPAAACVQPPHCWLPLRSIRPLPPLFPRFFPRCSADPQVVPRFPPPRPIRPCPNAPTPQEGRTPLVIAAWQGELASLRLLFARNAALDVPFKGGKTALHVAAWDDHRACVAALAAAGAQLNLLDDVRIVRCVFELCSISVR